MPRARAHRVPGVLRQPAATRCRASSRSRTSCSRRARSARGVLLAGLEHLDDRYLKAVGYATKSKRGGRRQRAAQDGADRRHRRRRRRRRGACHQRGGAHRQLAASGEGFIAVSADARKKFWLDRKRTAAIAKHTNAFKINEDVVIPLPRMGEYTEGIERINIELSPAQQARAARSRWKHFFAAAALPLGKQRRRQRDPERRAAGRPRAAGAGRCCARCARCGSGWLERSTRVQPKASAACSRSCRTTRLRASWKTQMLRAAARALCRCGVRAHPRRMPAHPQRSAARPRLGGAAHARRRRQRAHQHPGQQRRLRDAADRARGGRAHHGAGAQPGRRDLGRARHRHHQARVPDRRRAARLRRLQGAGRPRRAASTRASCCAATRSRGWATTCARRPGACLHAELRADGPRVADHAAERHRRDQRLDQGLPALRQVQAGVRHARAARQPAVQPAQQDPGHLAADRGLPLRRADAARHLASGTGRSSRTSADHCTVCHKCASARAR